MYTGHSNALHVMATAQCPLQAKLVSCYQATCYHSTADFHLPPWSAHHWAVPWRGGDCAPPTPPPTLTTTTTDHTHWPIRPQPYPLSTHDTWTMAANQHCHSSAWKDNKTPQQKFVLTQWAERLIPLHTSVLITLCDDTRDWRLFTYRIAATPLRYVLILRLMCKKNIYGKTYANALTTLDTQWTFHIPSTDAGGFFT